MFAYFSLVRADWEERTPYWSRLGILATIALIINMTAPRLSTSHYVCKVFSNLRAAILLQRARLPALAGILTVRDRLRVREVITVITACFILWRTAILAEEPDYDKCLSNLACASARGLSCTELAVAEHSLVVVQS